MSHNTKLHWSTAGFQQQGHDKYELWNDKQRLLTLYINQFSQTAKVECDNSRRNFRIEKEGFLRNKTILKNEYGVKIGELGNGSWFSNDGFIDLNGEKLNYAIQHDLKELVIYKSSKKEPLLACDFCKDGQLADSNQYPCLLMAMGWFLFMPIAQKQMVGFAA